jgi:short-subunit dehydrogenase
MDNNTISMALVTGATSGIGYELTKILAENGHNLILISRSQAELEVISNNFSTQYGVKVITIVKDLFEPGAAEELYNEVKAQGLHVNILVNDAAQGVYGKFAETSLQEELDIIQLNISSLVVLTKLFMKDMLAGNGGRILQLASVVSKIASPLMAVYAGTKAFVYNFTQSVINELEGTNVTMTALLPGATDTDFFNKAGAEDTKVAQEESKLANPADVAKDGYNALMSGQNKIISGLKNKMQMTMANVTPDQGLAAQMRNMNEEKKD